MHKIECKKFLITVQMRKSSYVIHDGCFAVNTPKFINKSRITTNSGLKPQPPIHGANPLRIQLTNE